MNQNASVDQLLGLQRRSVAVKFQESAPAGMSKVEKQAASGCSYWKQAADGNSFYTEAADHFGCPVGSYTHGIEMPDETAKELEGLIGTMVELQYIDMAEVAEIPTLEGGFGVAIYAPLAEADFEPDAVIVAGNAKQMMLLAESAHAAGIDSDTSMVGRPTCAAIPAVLKTGRTATNLGCIGNRVYTELEDDEFYFVIAGSQLANVAEKLNTIVNANTQLESFHRERAST